MVRPIEISDAISKAQEVGRMQQNEQMRSEAAQEFQKSLSTKMHLAEVHSPNPTPATDQVVLHDVEEQEREKRQTAEDQEPEQEQQLTDEGQEEHGAHDDEMPSDSDENDAASSGHIDVKA